MSEIKKNSDDIEFLLQQYEPAKPSELKKQQILSTAKKAWCKSQSKPALGLKRFIQAIAACIAIIITIELAGNAALTRWRPSAVNQAREQSQTTLTEYNEISPSVRYCSVIIHKPESSNLKQFKNYRTRMQNLLDESEKVPLFQPIRENKSQGRITPVKSIGAYSC